MIPHRETTGHLIRSLLVAALLVVPSLSLPQAQAFRFAWLSDTHVGSSTGAADLRATVSDINTMNDVAFVILSGDITEMGSNAQLELAQTILDSLNKPYYILPGNHDTKWSESGCTGFPQLWGNDKFTFEYAGYRFIGLHQGPIMKMGDGHFAPEDLRWLDSVLTHLPNEGQPLLFITHYPLDASIDNWYQVTDRLRRHNTKAVLVGHGHRNRALNFEGLPGVMGRSNLRGNQPVGGFTLVDIQADTALFLERIPGKQTKAAWHRISLEQKNYFADTTTYSRPDFSTNSMFPHVAIRWKVNTAHTIATTPAIWKDYVIIGNRSGTISAFALRDGFTQWSFRAQSAIFSTPATADGRVVFGSTDRHVYCLDAARGQVLWKVKTGAPVVAAPVIDNATVYIGGSDSTFRALDLKTGVARWEFKELRGFVETKPFVYANKVIFGAWDTYLYALHTADGSLAWKWSNGNPGPLLSPAACWPVASTGKIFVAAPDRFLTAVDAETGKTVWRSNRYQVRETVGISQDGSRAYARCMTDTLIAFSPVSPSFSTLWVTPAGYGYDIDPSMPVEKDGVVFFGTKNGLVIAVNGETGQILWKHRVGETIVHTPVPLDARRVVISDLDGRVMLLQAQ